MSDIKIIAKARYKDSMATWPQHNDYHRKTIMGAPLGDELCLRCALESVAADEYRKESEIPKIKEHIFDGYIDYINENISKKVEFDLKDIGIKSETQGYKEISCNPFFNRKDLINRNLLSEDKEYLVKEKIEKVINSLSNEIKLGNYSSCTKIFCLPCDTCEERGAVFFCYAK